MSSTGNQFFSKVENTNLAPSALNSQHIKGKLSSLREISGTCVPTAIGSYAILDNEGSPIIVPANLPVIAVLLSSDLPLTSGGLATVTCGLSATLGAAPAVSFLAAPAGFANVNLSVNSPSNAGAAFVGSSNQFLTATIAGAAITSGKLRVTILAF